MKRTTNVLRLRRGDRRPLGWEMGTPPGRRRGKARGLRVSGALTLRWLLFGTVGALMVFKVLPGTASYLLGPEDTEGCRLISVVDGDTVRLMCPTTGIETVRLTGFDTPEIFSPDCPRELWQGLRAAEVLQRAFMTSQEMTVRRLGRDRYDRVLASVTLDGRNVSSMMIERGLARPYAGGVRSNWCA